MSTEKIINKDHKTKVLKSLLKFSRFSGTIGLFGILGFPTAFITWIWTDYIIFFKIIATSVILMLLSKFLSKVIETVKKQVNKLEVSD